MNSILRTKINIPGVHPGCILRPRLVDKLCLDLWHVQEKNFFRRLTLIAAPAGYGKSTLLNEWIQQLGLPVAWITLDESDNDPGRFFQYLGASLQTLQTGSANLDFSGIFFSQNPDPSELISNLVISLVNDLSRFSQPFLLVLDDYHSIKNSLIHQTVELLIENLPQNLSLVIATRSDPPFPLSRWRARRHMVEVRSNDLRFTKNEAQSFFEKEKKLDLASNEILLLNEITEGWIAGLQMVSLALQGSSDHVGFIRNFSGRERFIIDYLFEEVFSRQSFPVQSFLLRTSILEQLTGPLCDTLWTTNEETDQVFFAELGKNTPVSSQTILEYLDNINLFLVPLDNERCYYRYHHLFSDLLQHRLKMTFPDLGPQLHASAALWFEKEGYLSKAFEHWMAAGNLIKAADLIEKFGYQSFEEGDIQGLIGWLQKIPPELICSRPWLCIFHSWGLIFTGRYAEAKRYMISAENVLGEVTEKSQADLRDQFGHVAVTYAFLASRSQDAEGIFHYTDLALKFISPEKQAIRVYISFFLGTARYKKDQYHLAQDNWRETARLAKEVGNLMMAVNGLATLAELNRVQGKLHESRLVCQEAAGLAQDPWGKPLPISAEVYVNKARLFYEWNDLQAAKVELDTAAQLMKLFPGFDLIVEYNAWLSSIYLSQNNCEAAGALIREIENSDQQPFYKSAAVFLSHRIKYYLAIGDLEMAEYIIKQQDWNLEEKNIFAWSDAFISYARVLYALNKLQEACEVLKICLAAFEKHALWTPAIKTLVILASISKRLGNEADSLEQILRALQLAEPEGFIRAFIDGGNEVKALLVDVGSMLNQNDSAEDKKPLLAYLNRLLAAFMDRSAQAAEKQQKSIPSNSALCDPLTEREMEVLKLIAEGFSNKEIAQQLFVTVGTVKTHTSNIYRKLDTIGRTRALAKARELNLI